MNAPRITHLHRRALRPFFDKLATVAAAAGFFLAAAPPLGAEPEGKGPGYGMGPGGRADLEERREKMVAKMADELGLEGERRRAFTEALEEGQAERKRLAEEHRAAMAAHRERMRETLAAVLDEEEMARFEELRKRPAKKRGMKERRKGEDGPPMKKGGRPWDKEKRQEP